MRPQPVPAHVIAAARLLRGPASFLQAMARSLAVVAAVAAVVIWIAVLGDAAGRFPVGTVISVIAAIVLAVPAWWLRHAASTFGDVIELPARLEALGEMPKFTIESREDLRALRTGGPLAAGRAVRATVGEVSEYISPASTVTELVALPFWIWTLAAGAASLVLSFVAIITAVAVLVF